MILVGLKIEAVCCTGGASVDYYCFECADHHEAAVEVLKCSHYSPWWSYSFIAGEFHDTETKRTWSVDGGGHTKGDYRCESDKGFEKRWKK